MLIVEDKDKEVVNLGLYNQVEKGTNFQEMNRLFPFNMKLAIKQPYMKLSYGGNLMLRNDNP